MSGEQAPNASNDAAPLSASDSSEPLEPLLERLLGRITLRVLRQKLRRQLPAADAQPGQGEPAHDPLEALAAVLRAPELSAFSAGTNDTPPVSLEDLFRYLQSLT